MSKIPVVIDYIKMAQYKKCIEYYLKKIQEELDRGVVQKEDNDE
jgi:hypothetical protein